MLVVVEYGMGNVGSVLNMLRRVGADPVLTSDPETIRRASKLILSGVGAFDTGMRRLTADGMKNALDEAALRRRIPVLGLCLGLHLFTESSEEGELPGLGWIAGRTVRFRIDPERTGLKLPHMGWNTVHLRQGAAVADDLLQHSRFYFVHSYHVECDLPEDVAATTTYGYEFPSIVQHENLTGTQFHPEKSHKYGMRLLERFVMRP